MDIKFILLLLLTILTSFLLTKAYRRYAIKIKILDIPGERSSHTAPTPRGGGISIVLIWISALIGFTMIGDISRDELLLFLPCSILMAGIGIADDFRNLGAKRRLLGQVMGAGWFLYLLGGWTQFNYGIGTVDWSIAGYLIGTLAIVWSVNLFNFMDGIDSIASVEALIVLTFGAVLIHLEGGADFARLIFILSASITGFLLLNLPPAKIFMGDGGSYLLGMLIATVALYGEVKYGVSTLIWVIAYGVFWFDATVTLVRRLFKGEKVMSPHRSHAYQKLHQYGWSHGKIVIGSTILNAMLITIATTAYIYKAIIFKALLAAVGILAIVYIAIEKLYADGKN